MNTLSTAAPWDNVAEGYDAAAKHVFSAYARAALDLVDIRPRHRVVDIACGPGTLTTQLAERGAEVAAVDFSDQMLKILNRHLAQAQTRTVTTYKADGQALPFDPNQFDAAFSLFGLMFFPDRAKGYAEMYRTLRPGGVACVSSWSKLSDSPLFDVMAKTLRSLDPSRPAPEYDITSLENPDVLRSEMLAAGFLDVVVHRVERHFEFASAEELWRGLVDGSAPVAMMKASLPTDIWEAKSFAAQEAIRTLVGAFPAQLGTTAWMGVGLKPS